MGEHRCRHRRDVLEPHHVAAGKRGPGLGPEDQILHRAGPRAPGDQRFQPVGGGRALRTGPPHELRGKLIDVIGHRHPANEVLEVDDLGRGEHMLELRQRVAGGGSGDHHLFFLGGIINLNQEHEAVELCLGQWVGALLLDRVLRGQHEERRLQPGGLAHHRHLLLLHRLEHGGLRLGRGTVDLVGEHDVGEHRTGHEVKLAAAVAPLLQDVGASDVHRHQIGRELDAAELERHRLGQPAHQERLGEAGHAHQERMAAGEEADRQPFDRLPLANDDLSEFLLQAAVGVAKAVQFLDVVVVEIRHGHGAIGHGSHRNSWNWNPVPWLVQFSIACTRCFRTGRQNGCSEARARPHFEPILLYRPVLLWALPFMGTSFYGPVLL